MLRVWDSQPAVGVGDVRDLDLFGVLRQASRPWCAPFICQVSSNMRVYICSGCKYVRDLDLLGVLRQASRPWCAPIFCQVSSNWGCTFRVGVSNVRDLDLLGVLRQAPRPWCAPPFCEVSSNWGFTFRVGVSNVPYRIWICLEWSGSGVHLSFVSYRLYSVFERCTIIILLWFFSSIWFSAF
jgi:hypothetical protein